MRLLVIRHGIAEDRDEFAKTDRPDGERPLTDTGRRRMRRNARGLRRIVGKFDVLATSPYVRAAETARIVAEAMGIPTPEIVDALTPEHRPADLLPWLSQQAAESVVAVVGHEPLLGVLVSWLLTGHEESRVVLKKGGACLLDLGARPEAGTALIRWLLTPRQLRSLQS